MNNSEKTIPYASPHTLCELDECESVLLAYSGGADSTALLDILANDARKKGYTLHIAHFEHGIRGDESKRDAQFCKETAKRYGLPFHLGSADVPRLALESGRSLEAEAREQRYAFFRQAMKENGIKILVTAHHAEDQVETVLLHILRGSGISGLCGMRECRPFWNGTFVVRPFLHTEKEDIINYCQSNSLPFVEDSTNSDTAYLRNALRAEITPRLRELQPRLSEVFSRLSENARQADDLIYAQADDFLFSECPHGYIPAEKLLSQFPAVQARIISELCKKQTGASLEYTHIASITELCRKHTPNASLSLPEGTRASVKNGKLRFEKTDKESKEYGFSFPFAIGTFKTDCGVTVEVEECTEMTAPRQLSIVIDEKHITENTVIRTRAAKDVIMHNGVHKKVKKLLCDKKTDSELRAILPLLAQKNEILWIPSLAVCDTLKRDTLNSDTKKYRITVRFKNI